MSPMVNQANIYSFHRTSNSNNSNNMFIYETQLNKLHRLFKNQHHHTEPSLVLDPYLFLGNCISAHDVNRLSKLGIRYILNVASRDVEVCPYYGKDFRTLQIDLRDDEQENILKVLEKAFAFIDEAKSNKCRVLVHCSHGQSRSPTIVIAYLMRTYNISLEQCLSHVVKARPCVLPNDGFLKQLILYDKLLNERKKHLRNSQTSQSNVTNDVYSNRPVDVDPIKIPIHHHHQPPRPVKASPPLVKSQSNDQQLPLRPPSAKDAPVIMSEKNSDVQVIPIQIKNQNVEKPPLPSNSPKRDDVQRHLMKENKSFQDLPEQMGTTSLNKVTIEKLPFASSHDDLHPSKRQYTSNTYLYTCIQPQVSISQYFPRTPFIHESRIKYITEIYDKVTNRFIPVGCF
ncbi:unnamed protein product [Didymodactylos carnosus]|uniref:protein-tyrosine-phosphatase n=2 Tax=Didymodactylos carnosus TaxID=1234261 RepID=A0A815CFS6_9BILA|nr:unnamed protein product [Didymodactylos carnosus]CAF4080372.1 unnamed protein product [Didymodactylos carnosus]